jgi:low affinity Fe/Cu permease
LRIETDSATARRTVCAARCLRGEMVERGQNGMHTEKKRRTNGLGGEPYSRSHVLFRKLAQKTAHGVGHPWAFSVALGIVVTWAITGPIFHFSDTWQLVINTGTTIVTFLMVFLIQNTQNRDSHALHLKLDELIRSNRRARNQLIALEDLEDEELDELQGEFNALAKKKIAQRRTSRARRQRASARDEHLVEPHEPEIVSRHEARSHG